MKNHILCMIVLSFNQTKTQANENFKQLFYTLTILDRYETEYITYLLWDAVEQVDVHVSDNHNLLVQGWLAYDIPWKRNCNSSE